MSPTIHASAVLVGPRAVLIRGPSGSGKSRLVLAILQAGLPFARLVGDDRVHVEAIHGQLLVRPAETLAGLIEVRGIGIRQLPYEPVAAVGLIMDLGVTGAPRMPEKTELEAEIASIRLPRLAVATGTDPLPLLLAHITIPRV